jgi:hypothetical protein
MTANPLRGEVDLELEGEKFVLRRSFGGLARFQQALGLEGLPALLRCVVTRDARAMLYGPSCLAVSGDTRKLEDMDPSPEALERVAKALEMVIIGPTEKNDEGAKTENPS